jgi:hypothetical protein
MTFPSRLAAVLVAALCLAVRAPSWAGEAPLPLALGLSLDKYYEVATSSAVSDETFGLADLGLMADVP